MILLVLLTASCDKTQRGTNNDIGDFKSVAQQSLARLEKGKIIRIGGFNIECAVDFKRERGMRISETVCDKENIRNITIRVTDPGSRPPSQKVKKIQLTSLDGKLVSVHNGETKTMPNGFTVTFDRSGQSVTLGAQFESQP